MEQLQQRADQYTKIITDIAMDSDGVILTSIHFDEMRPLEPPDMPATSFRSKGESPVGYFCYEDSGMALGGFLSSESLRYMVTEEPDAKKNADRAFGGFRFIYDLGKQKVEGYFPKPYKKQISDQISRDQYLYVLTGLANYYKITDEQTKNEIRHMMAKMAGYWMSIDYTHSYFGLPANSHLNDFMGSLFLGIVRYAHTYTGDEKFLNEYNRLFNEEKLGPRMPETLRAQFLRGETYDGAMYFRMQENAVMMKTMAIDHLWDADPEHVDLWEESLRAYYNDEMFIHLDKEDGMLYSIVGFDPEKNETFLTEPEIIEELEDPLNLGWIRFGGLRKSPRSPQVAYAAAVTGDRLDLRESVETAKLILEKMTLEKFRGITVPDDSHVPAGNEWTRNTLTIEFMTFWLWTYWLGRSRKLW